MPPDSFKPFYLLVSQHFAGFQWLISAFHLTEHISFISPNTIPCVFSHIIMSAEGIITGDTRRYHNMPMLTSEFTPSWASDTSWASPPGHLPFPVPWSVSGCFKDPCWATNSSYFDGNDGFWDTLNDSDGQSSLIRQNYQLALSPPMPYTWLGIEDYVFGGKTCISETNTITRTLTRY